MEERIADLILLNNLGNYPYYFSYFKDKNRETKFVPYYRYEMDRYNYIIIYNIISYIIAMDKNYRHEGLKNYVILKKYEPIFLKLLYDILINNANNISEDLTIYIILRQAFESNFVFEYLVKHGFIYLLARINPKKIIYLDYPSQRKAAECIYDDKLALQRAWMGVVIRASLIHM